MGWEVKFVVIVAFLTVGVIFVSLFGLMEDSMYIPTVYGENISAYKASCTEIDLNKPQDDLAMSSGQKVKIKGKFLVIDDGNSDRSIFFLKTDNLTYYPHTAISYSSNIPFKEGDDLEIYGEYDSFLEYANITVPFIKAAYIEKI